MSSAKPYVLLVEDDFDIREAVIDTLETEGHQTIALGDGAAALSHLRREAPPCLVLLDWNMAPMNGEQFLTEMRGDPGLADLPVVLMTADVRLQEHRMPKGLAGMLRKPVQLRDLFAYVNQYCRKGGSA